MNIFEESLLKIQERRNKIIKGGVTALPIHKWIPSSYNIPKYLIKGDVIGITGHTGHGKSRFLKFLLKKLLIEANKKNSNYDVVIFWNSLEEDFGKLASDLASERLYSQYGKKLSYYEMEHFLNKEDLIDEGTYKQLKESYEFMSKMYGYNIIFTKDFTPEASYTRIMTWLFKKGTFYYKDKKVDLSTTLEGKVDRYEPNNKKLFVFNVVDTIDKFKIKSEESWKGLKNYTTIADQIMGEIGGVITLFVQQQSGDASSKIFYKGNNVVEKNYPSFATLAGSRDTKQATTLFLGIFDPLPFLSGNTFRGIDIEKLQGHYRSLLLMKARHGQTVHYPLHYYVDFHTNIWFPMKMNNMEYWYNLAKQNK